VPRHNKFDRIMDAVLTAADIEVTKTTLQVHHA
jgi:hypothetical protein